MKKKNFYFIISAIFQIIFSIYSIIMIDFIRKNTISSINFFPEFIRDRMLYVYSNDLIFIVPNIISVFVALICLFFIFKRSIEYCRNIILVLSFVSFIISSNFFISFISIVNIIVAATTPSKSVKHERLCIPTLCRIDNNFKSVILGVVCLICYFSRIFVPNFNNYYLNIFCSIVVYLIILVVCVFSFKDNLRRDFCEFKRNFKAYVFFLIPRLIVMYVIYFILSFICIFILNNSLPVNQQTLDTLPYYVLIPLACVYAPIVEELLFRGCFRRFIRNDIFYIIFSGFVFGLLHTLSESSLYSIFTLMIPYSFIGSFFAYLYKRTNNIFSSILCHSFHNSLAIILQFFI